MLSSTDLIYLEPNSVLLSPVMARNPLATGCAQNRSIDAQFIELACHDTDGDYIGDTIPYNCHRSLPYVLAT